MGLTDDLVGEELGVVLTVEVRFGGLGRVELETFADTLAKNVTCRVGLHNLAHSLLDEGLHAGEPVSVRRPQVVCQVHADHDTSRRRINTHRVRHLEIM